MQNLTLNGKEFPIKGWDELTGADLKRVADLLISASDSDAELTSSVRAILSIVCPTVVPEFQSEDTIMFFRMILHLIGTEIREEMEETLKRMIAAGNVISEVFQKKIEKMNG